MSDINRLTAESVQWIDTDKELPPYGTGVIGLSKSGVLCPVIWNKNADDFFIAWMPYPKIPPEIKEKMLR